MARNTTRRRPSASPAVRKIEPMDNVASVLENVASVLEPIPTSARRQRIIIELNAESSTLSLNVTGPSIIEISG